jgi:transposase
MKRNLEFRISVEARTKEDEKQFINEIQKIEEEIKKARELKRIEKKIMLLGQDIEQTLARIRELNKKIQKPKQKNNKEIRLEDIVTIKKKES